MPTPVLIKQPRLFLAQFDMGDNQTEAQLEFGVEEKSALTAAHDTLVSYPGLMRTGLNVKGLWEAAAVVTASGKSVPDTTYEALKADPLGFPVSLLPGSGGASDVDGETALFFKGGAYSLNFGGAIGDLYPFDMKLPPQASRLVRGKFMLDGSQSSAGNGTDRQLGAVSATQKLYCAVHMLEFTGSTVTLTVESDVAGFAGPTTQMTLGPFTAVGHDFDEVAGPITDDYFRVEFSGTFTTFTAVVAIGIAAG